MNYSRGATEEEPIAVMEEPITIMEEPITVMKEPIAIMEEPIAVMKYEWKATRDEKGKCDRELINLKSRKLKGK